MAAMHALGVLRCLIQNWTGLVGLSTQRFQTRLPLLCNKHECTYFVRLTFILLSNIYPDRVTILLCKVS